MLIPDNLQVKGRTGSTCIVPAEFRDTSIARTGSADASRYDEYLKSHAMREHDQVLLQTFGFAYDKDLKRAVAVFLRYLHDLSPEHQRVWAAKD